MSSPATGLFQDRSSPAPAGWAPATTVPIHALFCSDLDRTLIYSANALMLDCADHEAPNLVVAEIYEGRPLSYLTRPAESLLAEVAGAGALVPVTTRTVAQYRRIRLPGPPPLYAVTTNGGRILVDGVPDPEWSAALEERVAHGSAPLPEIASRVEAPAYADWMLRMRDAEGLFLYAIVERSRLPTDVLADLSAWCGERGWTVSLQGRKLYCVPSVVTKEAAVAEVARRAGNLAVVAAGDSLLDAGLLSAATTSLRPAHGELEDQGFRAPRLAVTQARGVLAGEEIARRAHAVVFGTAKRPSPGRTCD